MKTNKEDDYTVDVFAGKANNVKAIKFDITITFSKLMAFLTLGLGSAATYILKDASIFIVTIGAVTAILGIKQVSDRAKDAK